jgi:hypothetical protein
MGKQDTGITPGVPVPLQAAGPKSNFMKKHHAIDADSHIFECQVEIQRYLKAP